MPIASHTILEKGIVALAEGIVVGEPKETRAQPTNSTAAGSPNEPERAAASERTGASRPR
jgi:hypothetical protein